MEFENCENLGSRGLKDGLASSGGGGEDEFSFIGVGIYSLSGSLPLLRSISIELSGFFCLLPLRFGQKTATGALNCVAGSHANPACRYFCAPAGGVGKAAV